MAVNVAADLQSGRRAVHIRLVLFADLLELDGIETTSP